MQILSSCGLLSHLRFSKGSSWLPNLNFVYVLIVTLLTKEDNFLNNKTNVYSTFNKLDRIVVVFNLLQN